MRAHRVSLAVFALRQCPPGSQVYIAVTVQADVKSNKQQQCGEQTDLYAV
jgi:hypothetical protein